MLNKKIGVSGCANCPFLQVWNDGEGRDLESISSGSCNHYSFNGQLPNPHFPADVFLEYGERESWKDSENDSESTMVKEKYVIGVKPAASPLWCPLLQKFE